MPGDLRPRPGTAIEQFSFVDALVAGLYDGAFAASAIRAVGDFGLGCGDALDGEFVMLEGQMFDCRGDDTVSVVADGDLLPFAEVVRFEPTYEARVTAPIDFGAFDELMTTTVPSLNLFYAIRLEGAFARMTVRDAVRQQKPFRGLADAVHDQHEESRAQVRGTIVGFRGPDVFQGLSVADLHLHFIADDRSFGGHVLGFELLEGSLALQAFSTFTLHLPEVASYLEAQLDEMDADEAIREAEGS